MTQSTKVTRTGADGWQGLCAGWAQAGECFEVQGVGARHLAFCKKLCVDNPYECQYDSAHQVAVFIPVLA